MKVGQYLELRQDEELVKLQCKLDEETMLVEKHWKVAEG